MAKTRLYPHRVASESSILWQSWWLEDSAGIRELPSQLKGWDYSTSFSLRTSIQVVDDEFRESTGLGSDAEIELVMVAESTATGQRLLSRAPFQVTSSHGSTRVVASLEVPSGRVAGTLKVYAVVVLGSASRSFQDRVANQPGARLAQSPQQSLALEDSSSRFPTDALDFKQIGFPEAPWTLLTTFVDLHDSFMATVRLLINTESIAGKAALDPERGEKVADAIRADIIRLLVAYIAGNLELSEHEEFEEDTVGLVVDTMTRSVLGQSLYVSCSQYKENPARFELLLADRINPWRTAVSE